MFREPSSRLQGTTLMGRLRVTLKEDHIILISIVVSCGLSAVALWVLFK